MGTNFQKDSIIVFLYLQILKVNQHSKHKLLVFKVATRVRKSETKYLKRYKKLLMSYKIHYKISSSLEISSEIHIILNVC